MIGGNIKGVLQVNVPDENEIGESVSKWHNLIELTGWIDMASGDSAYQNYNAKIQESTHVFLCDYKPIPTALSVEGKNIPVTAENARMLVNSKPYDVKYIDNPMELNKQLEIYLKYTGGV